MFKSGVDEIEKKILEDYKLQKQVEGDYFIDCQIQFDNTIKEEQELYNNNNVKNDTVFNSENCCIVKNKIYTDVKCSFLTAHNHDFTGLNNLKEIYNQWDLFINWSLNLGNSHYSFTINFPYDNKYTKNSYHNVIKDVLKVHPITKDGPVFWNNYKYGDFLELENDNMGDNSWWSDIHYILNGSGHEMLNTWVFTILEENEKGYAHIHGIIAIRNLIDYNKNVKNNILDEFKKKYSFCDILMKDLNTFNSIKGWVRYLHSDTKWIFRPNWYILEKYVSYANSIFVKPYVNQYNITNSKFEDLDEILKDNMNVFNCVCLSIEPYSGFKLELKSNFVGIRLNKNLLSEELIIDLIGNYMYLNELYINNNNVYKKIEESIISYINIGTIKELFFDELQNNIIKFYSNKFPIHFDGFDFYFLLKSFKEKMEQNILKIKSITNNKITFNFHIMEFSDGVYDVRNNLFIKRKNIFNIGFNIYTIKYYNASYDWIRKRKPTNWIKGLKNALGQDNVKDFLVLCLFIANIFQAVNEDNKRNYLYLYGPSNTGKTTYSSKVITRYFGRENIGSIVNDSNFKFQDINNKLFVILEEFRYEKQLSHDFLKLLGGEKLLASKKYAKEHIEIENLKGLIVSNNQIDEKNEEIRKALFNRLFIINFLNKIDNNIVNINETLEKEEANIILFCNKLFFSNFTKKQRRLKTISKNFNKTFTLNNKNKYNCSFTKYTYSNVLGKLCGKGSTFAEKLKFYDHTNIMYSKTEIQINGIRVESSDLVALTNTTRWTTNTEILGTHSDGLTQYQNYNYMAIVPRYVSNTFEERLTENNIRIKENIIRMVADRPDRVNIIEMGIRERLKGVVSYPNGGTTFSEELRTCINLKSKNSWCIDLYSLKWGVNFEEALNLYCLF